jgi:hypothetical protein
MCGVGCWPPKRARCISATWPVATAYVLAVNLDRLIIPMVSLHASWEQIKADYERLWNHTYANDAEDQLDRIIAHEKSPSELATTDAPDNPKLLNYWQQRVFQLYQLTDQRA